MTANQNDAARMLRETIAGMMNVLDIARTDKDGDKFKFVFTRAGSMLRLQETIESAEKALAATANVQAEEVPAHPAQGDAELPKLPDYAATAWKSSKRGPARFSMLLAPWFSPTATTEYLFTARQMHEYRLQSPASVDAQTDLWLEIGKAVDRACKELPPHCFITIDLEKDSGSVRLDIPPESEDDPGLSIDEFEADRFGGQINKAIDAAQAALKEGKS